MSETFKAAASPHKKSANEPPWHTFLYLEKWQRPVVLKSFCYHEGRQLRLTHICEGGPYCVNTSFPVRAPSACVSPPKCLCQGCIVC